MAKASRSTKKVISKAKKTTSRAKASFLKNKLFLVVGLAIFVLVGLRVAYNAMVQPSEINEVTGGFRKQDAPIRVDSNGCYEKQIQCAKAPCNPIMVCPAGVSPAPVATKGGEFCTQEAGTCLTPAGQCVGYSNGCQKAELCGSSAKQCSVVTKPVPTASPSCTCPPGAVCKLDARCNASPISKPSIAPTPTPKPSITPSLTPYPSPTLTPSCVSKIASLSLRTSVTCTGDTFSHANYTCAGGTSTILSMNGCLSAATIFTQVQSICGSACQGK